MAAALAAREPALSPISVRRRGSRVRRKLVRIQIPVDFAHIRGTNPEEAARLQAEVRLEFEHWLGRGYAATGIEVSEDNAEYLLEPWAEK